MKRTLTALLYVLLLSLVYMALKSWLVEAKWVAWIVTMLLLFVPKFKWTGYAGAPTLLQWLVVGTLVYADLWHNVTETASGLYIFAALLLVGGLTWWEQIKSTER